MNKSLTKIELFCEKRDVPAYAVKNGLSLELAARKVRYEFLEGVAQGKVATAHTASDNLETMIFNLTTELIRVLHGVFAMTIESEFEIQY